MSDPPVNLLNGHPALRTSRPRTNLEQPTLEELIRNLSRRVNDLEGKLESMQMELQARDKELGVLYTAMKAEKEEVSKFVEEVHERVEALDGRTEDLRVFKGHIKRMFQQRDRELSRSREKVEHYCSMLESRVGVSLALSPPRRPWKESKAGKARAVVQVLQELADNNMDPDFPAYPVDEQYFVVKLTNPVVLKELPALDCDVVELLREKRFIKRIPRRVAQMLQLTGEQSVELTLVKRLPVSE